MPKIQINEEFKRKRPIFSKIIIGILLIASGLLAYFNAGLNIKISDYENNIEQPTEVVIDNSSAIELSEEQVEAVIETEDGEIEIVSAPTVETVDGGEIITDGLDLDANGRGAYYPTETPQAFKDATINKCVIEGNAYGAQCVSLALAFWRNYAERNFSTCGTGAASGAWNCKEQNAGHEFDLITKIEDLQAGDWIIFAGGKYGHVGMALGKAKNGYIALLGENQGGGDCGAGVGGSATNIINISLKGFKGAYRPKIYQTMPKVPDTGVYIK